MFKSEGVTDGLGNLQSSINFLNGRIVVEESQEKRTLKSN
jgi:hypothetical protein